MRTPVRRGHGLRGGLDFGYSGELSLGHDSLSAPDDLPGFGIRDGDRSVQVDRR